MTLRLLRTTGVCAILDGGLGSPAALIGMAGRLRAGGLRVFQLRMKDTPDREVLITARAIRRRVAGCALLLNDRCDLARAAGADGVHLGQDDLPVRDARRLLGPGSVVGSSAGTPDEVHAVVGEAPDYISLGPAFATSTKRDAGRSLGSAGLRRLARLVPACLPVLAVGGITPDNVGNVVGAGAQAAASASCWWRTRDPGRAARAMLDAFAAAQKQANWVVRMERIRRGTVASKRRAR